MVFRLSRVSSLCFSFQGLGTLFQLFSVNTETAPAATMKKPPSCVMATCRSPTAIPLKVPARGLRLGFGNQGIQALRENLAVEVWSEDIVKF